MADAKPISPENLDRARAILAELRAGHPAQADGTARDDLPTWQREQVAIWALNLESCLAQYMAGTLALVDQLRGALAESCDAFVECTGPYAQSLAGGDLLRWRGLANPLLALPESFGCPDGGTCHHECMAQAITEGQAALCWRTVFAGPLSAAGYPDDEWPETGGMPPVLKSDDG